MGFPLVRAGGGGMLPPNYFEVILLPSVRDSNMTSPRIHSRAEVMVSAGHCRHGLHPLTKDWQEVDATVQPEVAAIRSVCGNWGTRHWRNMPLPHDCSFIILFLFIFVTFYVLFHYIFPSSSFHIVNISSLIIESNSANM